MCHQCREALTTRQKLIAQDYKVSYSLAKACKSDLRKYHCNVDTSMPRAREARLSYLLLCLESAVHRGEQTFICRSWLQQLINVPFCLCGTQRPLRAQLHISHCSVFSTTNPLLFILLKTSLRQTK